MSPEVVTIGLGYIGLPTSVLIAKNGIYVHGVDTSKHVVDTVNAGKVHIVEPDLGQVVKNVVQSGYFRADTKPVEANVYLIMVPSPFKENKEPDISYIRDATENIIPLLKDGDLCVLESTSPLGTTEKMMDLIFLKRPELKEKIFLAYCPERVLPGNSLHELVHNDRIIGGVNIDSTNKAIEFYRQFVKGVLHATNARTAEMCKLAENSSRDVQIAFANELSIICDKAGINVWELISLANMHPRVNILQPGCGVGGHCIAVDPYFIVNDFSKEAHMIAKAREINNYKSLWCLQKIRNAKLEFQLKHNRIAKIAIMGLSYKPNIGDLRESPALDIAKSIWQDTNGNNCFIVEPNILQHEKFKLTSIEVATEEADLIVFLVAHDEFKSLIPAESKLVLDFCGVSEKSLIKQVKAESELMDNY